MNTTFVPSICSFSDQVLYEAHATFAMVATILALVIYVSCCQTKTVVIEHSEAHGHNKA